MATFETSFVDACHVGDAELVKDLFDQRVGSRQQQKFPREISKGLYEAILKGHKDIVHFLLSNGVKFDGTCFIHGLSKGTVEIVEELMEHGLSVNSLDFKEPPIRVAVANENVLKWLLEHGADPNISNKRGDTALKTAVGNNLLTSVEILLLHGAKMPPDILHQGLRSMKLTVPMLRLLVENGADLNYVHEEYGSPLHHATYWGEKKIVQALLDAGANVNIVEDAALENALTPAELAKKENNKEVYDMLVRALNDVKASKNT
ncbi:hypothetical protein AJ79_00261 [Helicocarpus griseus UAMH5409]|uniref:Uncharacterized protein n=1 Tax=Helicocarpus griseus UAMH5409 TaxID=1447875 RepID=A0A2B7YD63_9EURO|nr:hypothetical protein AJ79_00261 [Helicocarpus griseus UAMH5409]